MVNCLAFDLSNVLVIRGSINQPLLALCQELSAAGFRLGIITNRSNVPRELLAANLFDPIITAADTGHLKPHPAVFNAFLRQTGVLPSDCLFIDDATANISAAASLGFLTHQYTNLPHFRQFLKDSRIH